MYKLRNFGAQEQDVPAECHPDQTTLCDFMFFSYCFHAHLRNIFDNNSKGKRPFEKMVFPAAPETGEGPQKDSPALVKNVETLLQRVIKCLKSKRFLSVAAPSRRSLFVATACFRFFEI